MVCLFLPWLLWQHVTHAHSNFPTLTEAVLLRRKELALMPVNSVYSIQTAAVFNHIHQTTQPLVLSASWVQEGINTISLSLCHAL